MADVFSKRKRSEVMSRIRSRGNRDTELAMAHLLRAHKISGWRRHVRVAVESSWLSVEGRKGRNTGWRRQVRATVESSWLKVERKRTSPRPSPQRGEGEAHFGPQPSTFNPQLAVRPDFVFLKSRTAIFVDGCFWHGCPKHATKPANNRAFWRRKLAGNKTRDRVVNRALRRASWRVLRIWECDLAKHPEACVRRIQQAVGVEG
jgi:DNA mismatch endonuclease (patch repair protein)